MRAEGPVADHGICGVAGDVEHGREVEVDADRGELAGHRAVANARTAETPCAATTAAGREVRERRRQPMDAPALVIDRDQNRLVGQERTEVGGQRDERTELGDVAAKQDHTARGVAFQEGPRGPIERWAGNADHEELASSHARRFRHVFLEPPSRGKRG